MNSLANQFISYIEDNEKWLIERILFYSQRNEYIKCFSSNPEIWQLAVSGISESLVLAAKKYDLIPPELNPDEKYNQDPVSLFGMLEARRHRQRGITLSTFLGLLKYYRQAYLDLISNAGFASEVNDKYLYFTGRCFDRIELGYSCEWSQSPEQDVLQELQNNNLTLFNEKNKYLTVFDGLFSPVILLNEKHQMVNFNLAATKIFTEPTLAVEFNSDFTTIAVFREIGASLKTLYSTSANELCFETYLETNIGNRYFQVLLKKMNDANEKFKGSIIVLNDLTYHKEIEQHLQKAKVRAEEADKLKTAFIANMSHEIRTPMNAILGFTELMIASDPSKTDRLEYLKLIRKSSSDLLNIIEDLIDIAKIESKQLKIKYTTCKPFDLIMDLQALFMQVLRRYGINDTVKLLPLVDESDRDLILITDSERLKQVLSNLLNNSAKFTDKGSIEFGFRTINQDSLLFFVRDTGTGIPENMRSKIFDRFTQVEQESAKNSRGAGLGLAISKNIIEILGGRIWVESEEGKGSEFYFQLPRGKVSLDMESKSKEVAELQVAANIDWSLKTVLVAEDDETNFQYLSEVLKATNIKILWVRNGLEAINTAESEEKIDLILMDMKMPEIDGFEASKYITTVRPEIPIVAQTAFALDGDKAKCLNAGCVGYITKPVEPKKLFQLMEKYMAQHSKRRESAPLHYSQQRNSLIS